LILGSFRYEGLCLQNPHAPGLQTIGLIMLEREFGGEEVALAVLSAGKKTDHLSVALELHWMFPAVVFGPINWIRAV